MGGDEAGSAQAGRAKARAGKGRFAGPARLIESRDNPKVKRWARLARDGRYRRTEGRALIEGPHLVACALANGVRMAAIMVSNSGKENPEIRGLVRKHDAFELSDRAFAALADAGAPQGIAAEMEIPPARPVKGHCAFLEGIQDAGNVGAIIRSAAAFGIRSVVLDRQCADPWSPKVLRAGMGGHFRLEVASTTDLAGAIRAFRGTVLCTAAQEGDSVKGLRIDGPVGWLFGSEGAGISSALSALGRRVSIPTAPGTESLNVAAAAAICFYEGFSRPAAES